MRCAHHSCCGPPVFGPPRWVATSTTSRRSSRRSGWTTSWSAGHEAETRTTGSGSTGAAQHSGVSWVPFDEDHPFHGQVMQLDASPIPLTTDTPIAPGSIVGLGWFCRKEVRAEDAITFDDTAIDAYGMPAMRIHYGLTDNDRAAIQGAIAGHPPGHRRRLGTPLDENPIVLPAGTSLHYQGSTRMGPSTTAPRSATCTARSGGTRGWWSPGTASFPRPPPAIPP